MTASAQMPTTIPSLSLAGEFPLAASGDRWLTELQCLLRELEASNAAGGDSGDSATLLHEMIDDRLVQTRLGVAASLFTALKCRNASLANHSLRVALTCSAWAEKLKLSEGERNAIEVAALLHDIGAIGIPDSILLKPGMLDVEEAAMIAHTRRMSFNILRQGCASPEVLGVVDRISAWYDGSKEGFSQSGQQLPLGARMIAIVEAFDAMTSDQVYRPAYSQDRAMAELFQCAGTQFDPELVQQFCEFCHDDPAAMRWEAAHGWLKTMDPAVINACWRRSGSVMTDADIGIDALFQDRLLDNMYDAVVFIDAAGRIALWNRGAERLTGINVAGVRGKSWNPALLQVADEKGRAIKETDCPVNTAIRCGAQSLRRLTIVGRGQRRVAVDTHAIPVIDKQGAMQGVILLFHDASSELSLEQQCHSLHEKATKDPLTQVANRAEFDRVHAMFVAAHRQQQMPCSLLMCDLDHFKGVNDTYGHQAGDDAIKSLASLLKSACRPGDLVARYGGEEFVVLCADCDNASAARRADQTRAALSRLPQPRMGDKTVTVSFGVTEIQPGDTPETMLRRADRALLMAKANGRNTVVQLGAGSSGIAGDRRSHAADSEVDECFEQNLVTPVPMKIVVEKLRGFIADHQAKILAVDEDQVQLEIDDRRGVGRLRRLTDRPVRFFLELHFSGMSRKSDREPEAPLYGSAAATRIHVKISPRRNRDRRRNDVIARARDILMSFRSYLMAAEEDVLEKGDEAAL